jgi:hypothetical protein
VVDYAVAHPEAAQDSDFMQFALSATGATTWLDLPLRFGLVALGLASRRTRIGAGLWVAFGTLLFLVNFVHVPVVQWLYAATFPWLDQRPRQIVVVLASILAASGISFAWSYVDQLRGMLAGYAHAFRRIAVLAVVLGGFVAEVSAVGIYKRLAASISEQDVYSSDDGAAMAWLKLNAQPGELVVNDLATDAGIWAPYKADVPILLPRSASGPQQHDRQPILTHLLDLRADPGAMSEACALHADYVYFGAQPQSFDENLGPDLAALQAAPDLEEVFSSGQAAIFRIHLPCPAEVTK